MCAMPKRRPPYPPEFRREAVQLVRSGRSVKDVAESLGWLMRQAGVSGLVKVKRAKTTIRVPGVRVADDLVERQFSPAVPNMLWVADLTYLRTWEGWLYLAAVQDAFSWMIVGWAMAEHMRAEFVVDALKMGLHRRRPDPGLVHHSDLGSQAGLNWSSQHTDRGGVDGITRRRLRQCRRGELLRHDQEGARAPPTMADKTRAKLRRLRVHRGLLQPHQTTLHPRLPRPRGIREREHHHHEQDLATKARDRPRNGIHSTV